MPFGTITLQPGINTEKSQTLLRDGFYASNLVRWMNGLPQKLGGWGRISNTQIVGKARGMLAWADLTGAPYIIVGTSSRVQVYSGGEIVDVTPIRATVNITVDFSTVIDTPDVTVKDVAHGAAAGDWINIPTQVAVGGLVLFGYYLVATVVDADNYTITAASNATATINNGGAVAVFDTTNTLATVDVTLADHGFMEGDIYELLVDVVVGGLTLSGTYIVTSVTSDDVFVITDDEVATSDDTASQNGGDVRIVYLLPSGQTSSIAQFGYGIGEYGAGDYGLAGSDAGPYSTIRQWFWSQWGDQALGNYTNGPFYVWDPPITDTPQATVVSGAPTINTASFVSMPQQIAVALGAETLGTKDPNLVRWSAVADYTDFVATSVNQAGSFRIPSGSMIVGGAQGPTQGLIWTDLDLWSMRYIQPPFVFGFTKIAGGCGLISARAWAVIGGEVYWMSTQGFFILGADGVQPLDCPVWDVIFRNLNSVQVDKITAAPHSDFNEVAFYFPAADGSGEPDKYVKLNVLERGADGKMLWDYGNLSRLAWVDESALGTPIGVDNSGYLQQHETSPNADGDAMDSWIETGFIDLSNGLDMAFIDQMIPDFKRTTGSSLYIVPKSQKYPNGAVKTYATKTFEDGVDFVNLRMRGRQFAFRLGSDDLDSFWRLGLCRYRFAPDGRSTGA